MEWRQEGQWVLRSGPWVIGKSLVEGQARYCLTRDGVTEKVFGLALLKARYFDDAASAKAVAEQENDAP